MTTQHHVLNENRDRRDFARSSAGKHRRNDRRARIAAKAAWLNG